MPDDHAVQAWIRRNEAARAEDRLATRLGRLDIMQWVPGITGDLAFEHLTRGAIITSLGGRPVRICSRESHERAAA